MYSKLVSAIKTKPFQVLLLVFALLVVKELIYIGTFGNHTSPIADGYSEANTIRGGTFFVEEGLTKYFGLPDLCHSNQFADTGFMGSGPDGCADRIYTHYPPGPEYMAWLGLSVVGIGNYYALRLLPIGLSILVGFFFLKTFFTFVGGGVRGFIFGLMLILPPMYSNYMHGLHHQQYAFIMLQAQMALCLLFMTQEKFKKWWVVLAFIALGFWQGWMTFDYAFLATLFAIPFYLYLRSEHKVSFLNFVTVGLSSGVPFTAAHVLHFYQVVAYYGSFDKAWADLFGTAKFRATNVTAGGALGNPKYDPKQIGLFTVARDFLYRVAGRGKYLAINLMNFIWLMVGLRFMKKVTFRKGWSFEFDVRTSDLLAIFAAIIVSSLWSMTMKQHAHIHGFIARHYYFTYFFCCLTLVQRTKRIDV